MSFGEGFNQLLKLRDNIGLGLLKFVEIKTRDRPNAGISQYKDVLKMCRLKSKFGETAASTYGRRNPANMLKYFYSKSNLCYVE